MASLPIITGQDHPILRKKTANVSKVTPEIKKLLADMRDTLAEAKGVGLAAPQVGESLRVCLATIGGKVTSLINPEIIERSPERKVDEEGCLSLPNIWLPVPRHVEITLQYQNERGKKHTKKLKNFDARVVQHELDHLDGVLIVDYKIPEASLIEVTSKTTQDAKT